MKRQMKIQIGGKGRPITVPEPTDYSAKLEAARRRLRAAGRAQAIDPPPKTAVLFAGAVYPFPVSPS